jgi:hypothetical protein
MPEIGTSGSMSGDGKRSVAEWPKLSRPSSTLPKRTSPDVRVESANRSKADIDQKLLDGLRAIGADALLTRADGHR